MNGSFLSLLEYNCFTVFCWFLQHNIVNQPYVYICALPVELPLPFHPSLGSTYPSFFEGLWVVCCKILGRAIGRASWQGSQLVSKGPNIHFLNVIQTVYSILFQFCVEKNAQATPKCYLLYDGKYIQIQFFFPHEHVLSSYSER